MIKSSDLKIRALIIIGLVAVAVFNIFPLDKKINLGLDLKGGMYVILKADTASIAKDKIGAALEGAIEKLRNRIDAFGVKETSIQAQGLDSILVQIPGVVDREIIKNLKDVGKLDFNVVNDNKEQLEAALKGTVPEGYELKKYKGSSLLVKKDAALSGADLAESFIGFDNIGAPSVKLKFTSEGGKKFAKVTEENVGKMLAIILDNEVMSSPMIKEAIMSSEAEITGDFTMDEARLLTSVLNSGALPVPLSVEEERTVGPILGSDSIKRGVNSCILGFIVVSVFMLVYYFLGGLVAVFALLLDLLFVLWGLSIFKGTLTLPGIAGMVLTLGMAVDGNVLIYERIREELALKKPLRVAIQNGFANARSAIVDSNLTTLVAALCLLVLGTGPIKGFATTLTLGILASLFTVIFVSKTICCYLLDFGLKSFPMLQLFPPTKIDFVKWRNVCAILSLVVITVGLTNFFSRKQAAYGVDFQGGQVLEYKITPAVPIDQVRALLQEKGFSGLDIQDFKDIEGGIIIKSKEDIADKSETILKEKFGKVERLTVTKVGPTVGNLLKRKAILAVIFSLLGILIYVAFRFKHFDFAIAGVIALFHDILISIGLLSLAGYEMNLLIVTALLTIAGFSINDTIVIYDRIREISPRMHKASLKEIINAATNSTLSRTIITSLTAVLVVLILYLFAGEALRGFSFTLVVGFIAGVYSTVYIAAPLVILFRKIQHRAH